MNDDDGWSERALAATEVLEAIVADRGALTRLPPDLRQRLLIAAGQATKPDKKALRAMHRAHRKNDKQRDRDRDEAVLARTGIRTLRANPLFETPRRLGVAEPTPDPVGEVDEARTCYVCRREYRTIHHFYDQMCVECGDFNYDKRSQTADLRGRVALVTGARVKIGYQASILMLRAGCTVVATTRFPHDAARRYAAEADFADWADRLHIHGIDLRRTPAVEALCDHLASSLPRLDFIINNACQTVRRPPGFYAHLMDGENQPLLSDGAASLLAPTVAVTGDHAALSQIPLLEGDHDRSERWFPAGRYDADLQQIDLRVNNSWRLKLAEVPTIELLEVHLVNAVAPYVLNGRLKSLMMRTPERDKHIVNVSAMEGQFYRTHKSDRHPHTNMAKAALNMMTRTSAADYAECGIHMNSVDTGWVTDEDPAAKADEKRSMHGFHPPLDIVDGAARIIDPIFEGFRTGRHTWGLFLKDYRATDW
jgi:NAD(P)-dependent dehydrogenase (short-subunit alcohol dehydrogenase family)